MRLSIVVLNYNTYEMTINLVRSILEKKLNRDIKIIVVDNASTNNSMFYLEKLPKDVELIINKENGGYAKGNNIGLKKALMYDSEYVLIMNNDIELEDLSVIDDMMQFMDSNVKIGAMSPAIINKDGIKDPPLYINCPSFFDLTLGIIRNNKKRYIFNDNSISKIYAPRGSFMILRMESVKQINFLDENTFLYYEEPILAERLLQHGKECWHYGKKNVVHNHGATISNSIKKRATLNFLCDSFQYYLREYRHMNALMIWTCVLFRKIAYTIRR